MTQTETVPIKNLTPHPDNPRQGDIGAIAVSIQENGWYGTLVAQQSTGVVLAGNHRLQAAKQLGMKELPVYWVDVDDTTARKILLADNRVNDLASYDSEALAEILTDLATTDDLLGTGYDGDDLDDLLSDMEEPEAPPEFPSFDDDLETEQVCPKCGYEF
jgi:ParB-like chromosome segregation protein Spo0J